MAGIPLVASVSFGAGQLDGAPISSSNGHLLVIVGFEADGDVVVNDPAAPATARSGGPTTAASSRTPGSDVRRRHGVRRQPLTPPDGTAQSSPALNVDRVPPGGAVGHDVALDAGLHLAVACRRAHPQHVVAGRRPSTVPAHCTQVSSVGGCGELDRLPGPAVERDLDALDADVLLPGDAADPDLAGRDVGARAGHVDPRGQPDRPLLGPALPVQ